MTTNSDQIAAFKRDTVTLYAVTHVVSNYIFAVSKSEQVALETAERRNLKLRALAYKVEALHATRQAAGS